MRCEKKLAVCIANNLRDFYSKGKSKVTIAGISPVGGPPSPFPLEEGRENVKRSLLNSIAQFRESLSTFEGAPQEVASAIINLAHCSQAAQKRG